MKKHKKSIGITALFFCAVIICLITVGCKQRESDKPRIALIMKSLANEFFKTMEEGARSHHKEHENEYELKVVGIKDEQDVGKQID